MYDGQGVQIKLCKLGIGWLRSQMYGVFEGSLKVPRSQAHLGILYTFPVEITMYYLCRVVCTNKMFIVWHCNNTMVSCLEIKIFLWALKFTDDMQCTFILKLCSFFSFLKNWNHWPIDSFPEYWKRLIAKHPIPKWKKITCFRCIFSAMCTSRYCTLKLIK